MLVLGGGRFRMREVPLYVPIPFASRLRSPPRALPTETKVESGTSQSKSGTSVNLSNSGLPTLVLNRQGMPCHYRVNFKQISQSRPDYGLDLSQFLYRSLQNQLGCSLPTHQRIQHFRSSSSVGLVITCRRRLTFNLYWSQCFEPIMSGSA